MRRALPILLVLALAALAGCGGDDDGASPARKSTAAAAATTPAPAATATTPAPATTNPVPATTTPRDDPDSPYVVVSSLLGKSLPKEPGCRFAKTFVPDKPSPAAYDGALTLAVTCPKEDGFQPTGQIVNRAGSKPTEITCRATRPPQLYCIYVPSASVGLYFTGTDRAVVRRRLEHLIEIVQPLPTGITPLPGTSAP
ncbi:MAG TPA: hypothetical protein VGV67_12355 [Solirubrobacteraceae bacterium]|nr:hypothetical protein [Solirubrobacteraceae bacterium]